MRSARLAILLWLCAVGVVTAADLQPATYPSPSGVYALSVNPSERSGSGKGTYRLMRDRVEVWTAELPFTLDKALVADDGRVAGYAYSDGYGCDCGDFIVAIIDAHGKLLRADTTPRKDSPFLHVSGDPKARGHFLDAANDRYVVRIADPDVNAGIESWWVYKLSDGQSISRYKPKELMPNAKVAGRIIDARPLAGTPLTLLHWFRTETDENCTDGSKPSRDGARFTLVDADYKPVWSLDLPEDYNIRGDEKAEYQLREEIDAQGAILDASQPQRFALRHVADKQRVEYRVARDAKSQHGWKVSEITRTPFVAQVVEAHDVPLPPLVTPRKLGTIELDHRVHETALRSIDEFGIDDRGRFGVLRNQDCDHGQGGAFVLVDRDGRVLREIPLPPVHELCSVQYHIAWVSGGRWVVTTNFLGDDPKATAAWLDVDTGKFTALDRFGVQDVKALAGARDGGFVALTTKHAVYTMADELLAFDANGTPRWSVSEDDEDGKGLFSPEDVTVTTTGEVVVLEQIRDQLQIYGRDGVFHKTISLEQAWKRKPEYLYDIAADNTGGVIVHDGPGKPPVVRMKSDGLVLAAFDPIYANKQRFSFRHLAVASDAHVWTSDNHALLRLDAHGVVDRIIGDKPDTQALGDIAAMVVTPLGRIYAADQRTGAVHVYDESGHRINVCRPDNGDYDGELSLPSLSVSDAGDVFLTRNGHGEDFLHYTPDCTRAGVAKVQLPEVAQEWFNQPGTANRWVAGYTNVYLVDAAGKALRTLERAADGKWLEHIGPASAARDGSFALVSGEGAEDPLGISSKRYVVTRFARGGDAMTTWSLPAWVAGHGDLLLPGQIAYDAQRVAAIAAHRGKPEKFVAVFDANGKPMFRFVADLQGEAAQVFLVQPHEQEELWVFDGNARIERYALP